MKKKRSGVWVVERARLLIEYIVNYIEGSNPSHSDLNFKNLRCIYFIK